MSGGEETPPADLPEYSLINFPSLIAEIRKHSEILNNENSSDVDKHNCWFELCEVSYANFDNYTVEKQVELAKQLKESWTRLKESTLQELMITSKFFKRMADVKRNQLDQPELPIISSPSESSSDGSPNPPEEAAKIVHFEVASDESQNLPPSPRRKRMENPEEMELKHEQPSASRQPMSCDNLEQMHEQPDPSRQPMPASLEDLEDPDMTFLLSLYSDLTSIPDDAKHAAKNEIQQIIKKYERIHKSPSKTRPKPSGTS